MSFNPELVASHMWSSLDEAVARAVKRESAFFEYTFSHVEMLVTPPREVLETLPKRDDRFSDFSKFQLHLRRVRRGHIQLVAVARNVNDLLLSDKQLLAQDALTRDNDWSHVGLRGEGKAWLVTLNVANILSWLVAWALMMLAFYTLRDMWPFEDSSLVPLVSLSISYLLFRLVRHAHNRYFVPTIGKQQEFCRQKKADFRRLDKVWNTNAYEHVALESALDEL